MCSSFLEHFLHFWNITRGLRPILCFFCPRNAGSFCCRMIFRNQDLQWAHCYWGVIASRPSQWTELENVCFYVHIDLCIYHYFYISIYIHFKSMSLFSSVQFSRSVVSNSLRPHESQHTRPPCPSPTPGVHSDSRHRVSDAIQPSHPLSSPSLPAPNPSQHQSLFQGVNSSHEVAKVLEFQL